MAKEKTLILVLSEVYSVKQDHIIEKICVEYPYAHVAMPREILSRVYMMGTVELRAKTNQPTVGYLFDKFISGLPYEKNFTLQRDVKKLRFDREMMRYIQRDTTFQRQSYLREALDDLRQQVDLTQFDNITIHALYSKLFNESGAYFQIIRKVLSIESGCDFSLQLHVGKRLDEYTVMPEK